MKRRTFLRWATSAAVLGSLPALVATGRADGQSYPGPYWVFVTALGGWDPRFHFDPVAGGTQNRLFTAIGQIGEHRFAAIPLDQEALGLGIDNDFTPYLLNNEQFLTRYGARLTAIHGIDTQTNNHDTGQRSALSGKNPEGYPALGSLIAATHGPGQPIAFLSAGGYDNTEGLVPLARVTDIGALQNLRDPNIVNPTAEAPEAFHTPETFARIRAFSSERLRRDRTKQRLPRMIRSMQSLEQARESDVLLTRLTLPEKLPDLPGYQLNDLERFQQQAEMALSGFSAGLVVSANLTLGGFDTHGNHDRDQPRQLFKLWGGLAYLFDRLDALGLGQRTFVVVASDFGRGPLYNAEGSNAGKDHWPITSLLVSGPGIAGNRAIGGTDEGQRAQPVDPVTLQPASSGVPITPGSIHRSLRKLAGIDAALESRFPLVGEALPLFEA